MSKNKFYLLILIFYLLMIVGCQTVQLRPPSVPPAGVPGFYHRVEKGQTLWRISKTYSADLNEIININRISDASRIETGQLIFIPQRHTRFLVVREGRDEDFIWPAKGRVISTFGTTFDNMVNKGINIEPSLSFDVFAARSGKVVFYSDAFGDFGKTIIIEHGEGFSTVYARNEDVFIKAGQNVDKGAVIARIGSGARAKNRYLHFQIRKKGMPQNPYFYLP